MVEHYWLAVNEDRQVGQFSQYLLLVSSRIADTVALPRSPQGVDSIHKLRYTRVQSKPNLHGYRIARPLPNDVEIWQAAWQRCRYAP
jgi:hypothetical protein